MAIFGKRSYSTVNVRKRDIPNGLWLKCPACSEILYKDQLRQTLDVCSHCGHHFQMARADRIALLSDPGTFESWDEALRSLDPLDFTGTASYTGKIEENIKKTGYNDAVTCGRACLGGHTMALGVMDFNFLGASMGSVVGERITRMIERATAEKLPAVMCCASGGARMYEGLLSLMQMAKTSGALARHAAAHLPYISLLTHPTTAGVMASFATLGDVIVAEPNAMIGFAGPRVIKETTQQDLPKGFQRSEFLLKRGLLDIVVPRSELAKTLTMLLDYFCAADGTPLK
ncbi:MAG: acetyl-CoA carboxylase, carboxyltransferase subunit beta [Kiritimatiellia bacterium]|nr:acetyl-CoA carboxylase, carboxyltransferase subunit beta [Kiritimatiellia bacterium]